LRNGIVPLPDRERCWIIYYIIGRRHKKILFYIGLFSIIGTQTLASAKIDIIFPV